MKENFYTIPLWPTQSTVENNWKKCSPFFLVYSTDSPLSPLWLTQLFLFEPNNEERGIKFNKSVRIYVFQTWYTTTGRGSRFVIYFHDFESLSLSVYRPLHRYRMSRSRKTFRTWPSSVERDKFRCKHDTSIIKAEKV